MKRGAWPPNSFVRVGVSPPCGPGMTGCRSMGKEDTPSPSRAIDSGAPGGLRQSTPLFLVRFSCPLETRATATGSTGRRAAAIEPWPVPAVADAGVRPGGTRLVCIRASPRDAAERAIRRRKASRRGGPRTIRGVETAAVIGQDRDHASRSVPRARNRRFQEPEMRAIETWSSIPQDVR